MTRCGLRLDHRHHGVRLPGIANPVVRHGLVRHRPEERAYQVVDQIEPPTEEDEQRTVVVSPTYVVSPTPRPSVIAVHWRRGSCRRGGRGSCAALSRRSCASCPQPGKWSPKSSRCGPILVVVTWEENYHDCYADRSVGVTNEDGSDAR